MIGNQFRGNQNVRGSVITGSPYFNINNNEFDNQHEQFDLEVEYMEHRVSLYTA